MNFISLILWNLGLTKRKSEKSISPDNEPIF